MVKPGSVEPKEEPRSGSDEREAPEPNFAPSKPSAYSHTQYAVYTSHPQFTPLVEWVRNNNLAHEIHLNRTRFWLPKNSTLYTEFMLRWYHCASEVVE